jgi:hypothetical protein
MLEKSVHFIPYIIIWFTAICIFIKIGRDTSIGETFFNSIIRIFVIMVVIIASLIAYILINKG